MDEVHFTALFGERGHAGVLLQRGGILVAFSILTEDGEQSGGKTGPGSREGGEELGILVLTGLFGNESVKVEDAFLDVFELVNEGGDEKLVDFKEAGIGAKRHCFFDQLETLLDDFRTAASLLVVKLGDRAGTSFLNCLEGGPFGEKGDGQRGEEVTPDKLEGLWVVVFEGLGEFVGKAGPDVDELAAFFDEGGDLVGQRVGDGVGLHGTIPFVDEAGEGLGVAPIILGAGGAEGFAVFFDDGGIDQIDRELVKLAEEAHQVLAGLLDAEGDGLAILELGGQLLDPGEKGFGSRGDLLLIDGVSRRVELTDVDGLVGAVEADVGVVFHFGIGSKFRLRARGLDRATAL